MDQLISQDQYEKWKSEWDGGSPVPQEIHTYCQQVLFKNFLDSFDNFMKMAQYVK